MDDLDEVRAHLGYDRINIYGGSYGTRAALVYLRQHETACAPSMLDGVAPPDMRLPLFFARDAQRALDKLLADCAAEQTLHGAVSEPRGAHAGAARAARARRRSAVRLTHPRTGVAEDVTVNAAFVANIIVRRALFAADLVARAGADRARRGQRLPGAARAGDWSTRRAGENMSVGMQLSVVCAEDYPRITPEDVARESAGSVFARPPADVADEGLRVLAEGQRAASLLRAGDVGGARAAAVG